MLSGTGQALPVPGELITGVPQWLDFWTIPVSLVPVPRLVTSDCQPRMEKLWESIIPQQTEPFVQTNDPAAGRLRVKRFHMSSHHFTPSAAAVAR